MSPKQVSSIPNAPSVLTTETETERLKRDIYRSDMEKFRLFTNMIRTNAVYSRIKVTHK